MLTAVSYLLTLIAGALAWSLISRTRRGDSRPVAGPTVTQQAYDELLRFRAAVDACSDAIYVVDRETLKYVDVSASASKHTGFTREELIGMSPLDLIEGLTQAALVQMYDEIVAAGWQGVRQETFARAKDGAGITSENHRQAIQMNGRWYIVIIARDITKQKEAQLAAQRISRMFAALSATNEAIMRCSEPTDLYRDVCDAAVNGGKLLAASVCLPSASASDAHIAAAAGLGADQLRLGKAPARSRVQHHQLDAGRLGQRQRQLQMVNAGGLQARARRLSTAQHPADRLPMPGSRVVKPAMRHLFTTAPLRIERRVRYINTDQVHRVHCYLLLRTLK